MLILCHVQVPITDVSYIVINLMNYRISDCDLLICADLNTELSSNSNITSVINDFITNNNLSRCDVLFPSANVHTYINESLNCASVIDYMLTTNVTRTVAF